jgi:hypothetical protein
MSEFGKNPDSVVPTESEIRAQIEVRDNFEAPPLSKFWEQDRLPQGGLEYVDAPHRPGEKAIKMTVRPGDFLRGQDGRGHLRERAEIAEKSDNYIPQGKDVWYGLSFYIPEDFYVVDNRLVIAQWRTNETPRNPITKERPNPPLALRYINGDLTFTIKNENEWIELFRQSATDKGAWHDLLVNYQLGDDHQGHCTVALDGTERQTYVGHMGYDQITPAMHFRMGLYRDHIEEPQSLLFSRFRRGLSREFCEE